LRLKIPGFARLSGDKPRPANTTRSSNGETFAFNPNFATIRGPLGSEAGIRKVT